ncbi:hypothetical protein PENARI_c011G01715 [Penicillium arizonense]|uniref:Uncharacterized protein n=1 Tax=Penicillium arizonense TaxID=1835702 RepID=A0A1F5LGA4_PENAI|nr:hypothetical protein PENARI_c011G01715 [Penicillium arizonense]OGE51939.1 hypothetical protein PENARI_c011G01715 [Penicillium arizonense]
MATKPTYSEAQLETYLKRIGYSKSAGSETRLLQHVRQNIEKDAHATLCDLQRRHLTAIPWGNSELHYSRHHTISLDPESLFEKMVERRLDGYCMENTGLFLLILRSLGYSVYPTAGRVAQAAETGVDTGLFFSIAHMILIVNIDGKKYMVDVGFGNNGATAPLPLEEGVTATHIAPSEMRLVKENIIEFTDPTQKVWIYQTRYNPESTWLSQICFSEQEFLPQDFGVMNFSVSKNRASWFTQRLVCVRFLMDESGKEIVGQCIMSGKEVKQRVRGQTEVLQVMQNEEDRVKALAKYFDMHLRASEIQGIRNLSSQLK